jgi:hypothetical protein
LRAFQRSRAKPDAVALIDVGVSDKPAPEADFVDERFLPKVSG